MRGLGEGCFFPGRAFAKIAFSTLRERGWTALAFPTNMELLAVLLQRGSPMNHHFGLRAAVFSLGVFFTLPAAAQMEIKLGHVLGESHSWHVAAAGFAREVAEKTGGRVKINVYPSSQLGSEKDMIEGLQIGSQQAGLIGSGSFQPIEPSSALSSCPMPGRRGSMPIGLSTESSGRRWRSCSTPRTSSRSPGGRTASATSRPKAIRSGRLPI
jgi:hypothetical protein